MLNIRSFFPSTEALLSLGGRGDEGSYSLTAMTLAANIYERGCGFLVMALMPITFDRSVKVFTFSAADAVVRIDGEVCVHLDETGRSKPKTANMACKKW